MNEIHFNTVDLNLLRVFQALFAERSATLAGARLGLSQSAISHALGRLRRALNDELFVRGPDGLEPTARAALLGPQIGDALKQLESAISAPIFDPLLSDRHFVIGASAYVCAVLLPYVMRRFVVSAPYARLRVRGENLVAEELDRGRLDMIIGAFDEVPSRFALTPLFQETGVWVIRADHPVLRERTGLDALAGLPQVILAPDDGSNLGIRLRPGSALKRQPPWRDGALTPGSGTGGQSVLTVPDTYSALAMVRQTDMVALLPRRLAEPSASLGGLMLIEPAQQPAPGRLGAVTRSGEQGAVAWLLGVVRDAAAALQ
jgi:DNA-binding transcriptional LysR family regulator